ncbi:MAG: hypothetical protein U0Q21_14565 [Dermatophilaceae bacterium]
MTQIATTAPAPPAPPTRASAAETRAAARRHFFTGTPGRMRINAIVASLLSLAFGLTGFFALRALDGSINRAGANTEQVVRVQQIYTDLLRADAATTNGFLQGGEEPAQLRKTYDEAIARVATNIADAANAQPADGKALAALNDKLGFYTNYVAQARTYNRQTLPVGAQYLTLASNQLRSDILPIVATLSTANQARAETELGAGTIAIVALVVGLVTIAVLGYIAWWLAHRTHRILNVPLTGAIALVVGGLALIVTAMISATSTMNSVKTGDFASAVQLATARGAAYDAKANESLTLVSRGSGKKFETNYQTAIAAARTALDKAGYAAGAAPDLGGELAAYDTAHKTIRALDDGGDWDQAVADATTTKDGSANALFTTFDTASGRVLDAKAKGAVSSLDRLERPLFPWLVGIAGVLAALAASRSMTRRIEEYR